MQNSLNCLAIVCEASGRIREVLYNGLKDMENAAGDLFFHDILHQDSMQKAENFWKQLDEQGLALNWELNVQVNGEICTLDFTGVRVQDNMVITAGESRDILNDLYQELLKVNNEQTNLIREAYKKYSTQAREQQFMEEGNTVLQEMTSLNNELTNAQRELARQIVRLEKLNSQKNFFLGMAAHDLRNPLGSIKLYAELLQEDMKHQLSETGAGMLDKIQSLSRFMLGMVEDLLDVTKIDSGQINLQLENVRPGRVVQDALDPLRMLAREKDISLNCHVLEDLPQVNLDVAKFTQMVTNLLTNAIKYSPSGSTVDVRLYTRDGYLVLDVSDYGQGIPGEEMDRLFAEYQTTSSRPTQGEGSVGLGLAIARRLVEAHDGTIEVQSSQGAGTTFTITLPMHLKSGHDALHKEKKTIEQKPLNFSGRILVAEDEPMNQTILARYLDKMGVEYKLVDNGQKVLQALQEDSFDLILLDIVMPEMSGMEVLQRLRTIEKEQGREKLPVVVMSALDHEEQENFLQAGADDLLPKPFNFQRLQRVLGSILSPEAG